MSGIPHYGDEPVNSAVNDLDDYDFNVAAYVGAHFSKASNEVVSEKVPMAFDTQAPISHGDEVTKSYMVNFDGHLKDMSTKWAPRNLNFPKDKNYRLVALKVTSEQNTMPFRVGINIAELPVNNPMIGSKTDVNSAHYIIGANTPTRTVKHTLFEVNNNLSPDQEDRQIASQATQWAGETEASLKKHIAMSDSKVMYVHPSSPIVEAADIQIKQRMFSPKNYAEMVHEGKPMIVLSNAIGKKSIDYVINAVKALPFQDPEKFSATLVRLDAHKLDESITTIAGKFADMKDTAMREMVQNVSMRIEATYRIWQGGAANKVGNNMHYMPHQPVRESNYDDSDGGSDDPYGYH